MATKEDDHRLTDDLSAHLSSQVKEYDVRTPFGPIHVVVSGEPRLPAIFTYHDIGLNSKSCFEAFFNYPEVRALMKHFCVYHLNALGQQYGAPTLPEGLGMAKPSPGVEYIYPTMDELAKAIFSVVEEFRVKSFIGLGVGAGANILARFALSYPDIVDALVLVNGYSCQASWTEWAYQKWNAWYMKSNMLTPGCEEYLLWHWFGTKTIETNPDLVAVYSDYLKTVNPVNVGHFISSYIKRTDLGIWRELDLFKKKTVKNFKCPVMLVAGDNSPHLDETVELNGKLDPSNSSWMKFDCGGMILEEAPGKLAEAMRLFVQGLGYVPTLRQRFEVNHPPSAVTQ
jgi:pimeloyl-ACP methyl ester carboxylesterase